MAYLPGIVLSCCCGRRWHLPGDMKLPGGTYLIELAALKPVVLNITYGKSFLLGDAYPLVESS
jgi:hypothetical protein